MIDFVARADVTEVDWDAVVLDADDGWVFALFAWQELILGVKQWALQDHSFAVRLNGKIVAVVPLQYNAANETLGMSAWGGCGPIISRRVAAGDKTSLLAEIFTRCRGIGTEYSARAIEFQQMAVTHSSIANSRGINRAMFNDFDDLSGLTQVIDLSADEKKLWSGLAKNARNIIRRAENSGLRAELVNWREHLPRYYELHCETYRRTGVNPHPISYFAGIAEKMAPSGYAALFAAYDTEGRVVAYHNDAWFKIGALYHTGCSSNDSQPTGANYLLQWKAILAAKASGKLYYEVGSIFPTSADRKQQGLTFFKTRFGGEPHRALRSRLALRHDDSAKQMPPADAASARKFSRVTLERLAKRLVGRNHLKLKGGSR